MMQQLDLAGIPVDVVFKDIKNLHLSVHPPTGRVRIAAPARMSLDTVRLFAISKLGWIRQHQHKLQDQPRETAREYLERESHYLWGTRYLLRLEEADAAPMVDLGHRHILLRTRPGADLATRREVLAAWYRDQLRQVASPLIEKWVRWLGAEPSRLIVQRMKTRWGSCTPPSRIIRLNTELAQKPVECLDYVVLHELAHLLVPRHDARFVTLLDGALPNWRERRQMLNQAPLAAP